MHVAFYMFTQTYNLQQQPTPPHPHVFVPAARLAASSVITRRSAHVYSQGATYATTGSTRAADAPQHWRCEDVCSTDTDHCGD